MLKFIALGLVVSVLVYFGVRFVWDQVLEFLARYAVIIATVVLEMLKEGCSD